MSFSAVAGSASVNRSLIDDVWELKGILDKPDASQEDILEALSRLHEFGAIPTKVLSETLIGKSGNKLGKSSSIDIIRTAAMDLVCTWKQEHRKRKAEDSGIDETESWKQPVSPNANLSSALISESSALPRQSGQKNEIPEVLSRNHQVKLTPQREKVASKIKEGLGGSTKAEGSDGSVNEQGGWNDPNILAFEIEAALWKNLGENEKDYLTQARAIIFNLKDSNNSRFKTNVLSGSLPVSTLPSLPVADMASTDKMEARTKAARGRQGFSKNSKKMFALSKRSLPDVDQIR